MQRFEPTVDAALRALDQVRPDDYARTRNAIDGAVTGLSPYLTHGFLSLAEVYTTLNARHALSAQHKLVFELGWRAYYRHVWAHLGDGIGQSLHAGVLPDHAYQTEMPQDVLEARTGIPAIDLAVRELYASGYLHNHARMWVASYLVHLRKVHWHAGAQWMLGHLLDGDLASNHLSWQWVAGTGSSKPYLFNADNVAKYAPAPWHSPGSAIDVSYETIATLAHSTEPHVMTHDARRADAGVAVPRVYSSPIAPDASAETASRWHPLNAQVLEDATRRVAGRDVWLHHPWSLGVGPDVLPANVLRIGVGFESSHSTSPWSQQRWDFVTQGLRAQTDGTLPMVWGSPETVATLVRSAHSVHWQPVPHANPALQRMQALLQRDDPQRSVEPRAEPCLFEPVDTYCPSFSAWWKVVRIHSASALAPNC